MVRKTLLTIGAGAALSWALAAAAAAAEGGESNLFAGDLGNAVWTLAIFVLVILVLGKFAWGPLLETLQQREQFIRESLELAKKEREEAEKRLAEYSQKLQEARAEATEIVEEGRRDAEVLRKKIEEQAREESDKMVARARREIDLAKQTAVKEIYEVTARLATDAASRIIRKEMSPEDHERLIAESIDNLEELDAN